MFVLRGRAAAAPSAAAAKALEPKWPRWLGEAGLTVFVPPLSASIESSQLYPRAEPRWQLCEARYEDKAGVVQGAFAAGTNLYHVGRRHGYY